jgi:hypothetical protein
MAEEETEQKENETKKEKKPLDFRKGSVLWVTWNYVEAALLLVAGILAIIYSNNEDLQKSILIIIGAFLIAGGFLKVLVNFLPVLSAEDKAVLSYDMVVGGSAELAIGITLVTVTSEMATTVVSFVVTFVAILIIVAGASFLTFAIGFLVNKNKLFHIYMPILEIILALGLIALGIVMIYYKNEKVFNQVLLIVGGIILALGGLGLLVETTRVMLAANKAKKDAKASAEEEKKEDAVEVDATTKDEKKEEVPALEQKKEEPKEVKDEKKDEPKDDGVIDVTPKDEKK